MGSGQQGGAGRQSETWPTLTPASDAHWPRSAPLQMTGDGGEVLRHVPHPGALPEVHEGRQEEYYGYRPKKDTVQIRPRPPSSGAPLPELVSGL